MQRGVFYVVRAKVIGRSVKLMLAFASTIIPSFSLLKIHNHDFCFPIDVYVFRNGADSSTREGSVLYVGARFVAP
jgi:hypothetical protein